MATETPFALPVPHGIYEGVDQGVDYRAATGEGIFAVRPGRIIRLGSGWAGGTGAAAYELFDVPVSWHDPKTGQIRTYAGAYYAEENPLPNIRPGVHVEAGDRIATFTAEQSEIGFATAAGFPAAPRPPARPANQWTQAGQDFADWIAVLGLGGDPIKPSPWNPDGTIGKPPPGHLPSHPKTTIVPPDRSAPAGTPANPLQPGHGIADCWNDLGHVGCKWYKPWDCVADAGSATFDAVKAVACSFGYLATHLWLWLARGFMIVVGTALIMFALREIGGGSRPVTA